MQATEPKRNWRAACAFALWLALGATHATSATAQNLEVIGTTRATHLVQSHAFRPSAAQARLAEIRIRSGSLALHLEAVEILFADGSHQRAIVRQNLPPGHQSRAIPIDRQRQVREIVVSTRPGMRQGETTLQLLGKVIRDR